MRARLKRCHAVGSTYARAHPYRRGSWNRKPRSGYKVIFVPFVTGMPSGDPVDVLTGFVNERGEAMGRPVSVAIDMRGALLLADDVGNVVWRVTSASPGVTTAR